MIVFPAVDLKGGRCVRLRQGRPEESNQYYEKPLDAALHWQELGAEALHVVDLDGALGRADEPVRTPAAQNRRCIGEILHALAIPVQVGGGLRSLEDVEDILAAGAARAIIGTRAATSPEWAVQLCGRFPGRIVIALDALEGRIAIRGWQEGTDLSVQQLARRLAEGAPAAFLYTDISRDGMLTRPHFEGVKSLLGATSVPVIASGGVSSLEDIRRLGECGADAVIVGKALYENRLTLPEAIAVGSAFGSRLSVRPEDARGRGTGGVQ